MNYWLVKSDPETYNWDNLVHDKHTDWTGVRNYAARNHLRGMKKGDLIFFYHSGDHSAIVGTAKVIKEFYQDPTTNEDAWVCVDIAPVKKLKKEITLAQIKAHKELKNFPLVRIGRLSVMPVTESEWIQVIAIGKE